MPKFNLRRVLKSSIPLGTFTFFTLLVTFYLYRRPIALGNLQHLGWQAYDIVSFGNVTLPLQSQQPGGSKPPSNASTDWWDVEEDEKEPTPSSFRLDVWNPLTPHHTGCKRHASETRNLYRQIRYQ